MDAPSFIPDNPTASAAPSFIPDEPVHAPAPSFIPDSSIAPAKARPAVAPVAPAPALNGSPPPAPGNPLKNLTYAPPQAAIMGESTGTPRPAYTQSLGQDVANVPGREEGVINRIGAGASEMLYNLGPVQDVVRAFKSPGEFHEDMSILKSKGDRQVEQNPVQREYVRMPADTATQLAPLTLATMAGGPVVAGAVMGATVGGEVHNELYDDAITKGATPQQARDIAGVPSVGAAGVGAAAAPLFSGPSVIAESGLPGLARAGVGGFVGSGVQDTAISEIEHAATGKPRPTMGERATQAAVSGLTNAGIHGLTHTIPEAIMSPARPAGEAAAQEVQQPAQERSPAVPTEPTPDFIPDSPELSAPDDTAAARAVPEPQSPPAPVIEAKQPASSEVDARGAAPEFIPDAPASNAETLAPEMKPDAASVESVGARTRPSGIAGIGRGPEKPAVSFDDPAVEARYQGAKGIDRPSILESWKDKAITVARSFTRKRVHLDTSKPEDAKLDNTLRIREAQMQAAPGMAEKMIRSYVKDLDRGEYERFGRDLVLNDIVKDIDQNRYDGKSLPFGFKDRAHVEQELGRIQEQSSPKVKEALARRKAAQKEITQKLVDLNLLPKDVLNDDRYYHRQVMEYMGQRESMRTGGSSVKEGKRGFQKGRVGGGDFNTRYEQAEHEYLTHALRQIATRETLARIESDHDIAPKLREQFGKQWQDHVPADYSLWSPKIGTTFAGVQSIPESVASKVMSGARQLDPSDLREVFARVPGKQIAIPKHFADQLDHQPAMEEGSLAKLNASALASWKQWTLLNPLKALKYNINNMSGDVDASMAADPRIVVGMARAARDMTRFGRDKAPPDIAEEIKLAQKLGVIDSGQSLNEIPDISETGIFRDLTGGRLNPIKGYWEGVRGASSFRESLARLSAFRRARELIAAGKEPLWASKPSELKAITDPNERAAKLSRDLLGDYGNISEAGQTIRRRIIPFWSWMEINAPRYARLFANSARDENTGHFARAMAAKAAKAPVKFAINRVLSPLSTAAGAGALYALVHLYNKSAHPDVDDGFEDGKLRLILGKTSAGRVVGVKFQGAFSDVLGWVGMDDAPGLIAKLLSGEMSASDLAKHVSKAPINKLVQGVGPQKTAAEVALGRSVYPDVFNPRKIRDRGEAAAQALSVDSIYRAAKDIPQENPITGLLTQSTDPGENAYSRLRGLKFDWLEKTKQPKPDADSNDKSNALFYYKKALALDHKEQARRWLKRYGDLGGTRKGLERSVQMAHPLYGMKPAERAAFLKTLTTEQRSDLTRAIKWYTNLYLPGAAA